MSTERRGHVNLAMYPFEHAKAGFAELWAAVAADLGWSAGRFHWPIDVHTTWDDADMLVAQTCGWPLVTRLAGLVTVVGAFGYSVEQADGASGPSYRSAIVATRPGRVADFAGAVVAVNNPDSLSGRVSLHVALPDHGEIVWTGAHAESVRALTAGRAEVAAIDGVSLVHIRRAAPELFDGLHVVGWGPRIPSTPVIARLDLHDDELAALRSALVRHAPASAPETLIASFHPLDLADYAGLPGLHPTLFAEQARGDLEQRSA